MRPSSAMWKEASFSSKQLLRVSNSTAVTDSRLSISIAIFCGDNNACFDNQCGTISANSITYLHTIIKKKRLGHQGRPFGFVPPLSWQTRFKGSVEPDRNQAFFFL